MMDKTYEMDRTGPPPMAWSDYEALIQEEWQGLLSSSDIDERMVQVFLERHPCMVPGAYGPGATTGHLPHPGALISQPILPDYNYQKPDFMWLASDSMCWYPTLIEIESPTKRWFTAKGRPAAQLTQGITQLVQWDAWLKDPVNLLKFQKFYEIHDPTPMPKGLEPHFYLIYGRREEAIANPKAAVLRSGLQGGRQHFMTFDRLSPDPKCAELWCVKKQEHAWRCLSLPPTATVGPNWAYFRAMYERKDEAILDNPYLSDGRKAFLKKRVKYWDERAMSDEIGIVGPGDRE